MKISTLAAAFGIACLTATAAFATDAAAPAATPSPGAAMAPKPDKAATEAKSQECSKEADAKGLHGKERKKFREKCKKGDK
jgi:ribosomal protein L12E/L44/L45/RPP1/RPP2